MPTRFQGERSSEHGTELERSQLGMPKVPIGYSGAGDMARLITKPLHRARKPLRLASLPSATAYH